MERLPEQCAYGDKCNGKNCSFDDPEICHYEGICGYFLLGICHFKKCHNIHAENDGRNNFTTPNGIMFYFNKTSAKNCLARLFYEMKQERIALQNRPIYYPTGNDEMIPSYTTFGVSVNNDAKSTNDHATGFSDNDATGSSDNSMKNSAIVETDIADVVKSVEKPTTDVAKSVEKPTTDVVKPIGINALFETINDTVGIISEHFTKIKIDREQNNHSTTDVKPAEKATANTKSVEKTTIGVKPVETAKIATNGEQNDHPTSKINKIRENQKLKKKHLLSSSKRGMIQKFFDDVNADNIS